MKGLSKEGPFFICFFLGRWAWRNFNFLQTKLIVDMKKVIGK